MPFVLKPLGLKIENIIILLILSAYRVWLCLPGFKFDVKICVKEVSLLPCKDLSLPLVQGHHESDSSPELRLKSVKLVQSCKGQHYPLIGLFFLYEQAFWHLVISKLWLGSKIFFQLLLKQWVI